MTGGSLRDSMVYTKKIVFKSKALYVAVFVECLAFIIVKEL
jgi:hypothetical protein